MKASINDCPCHILPLNVCWIKVGTTHEIKICGVMLMINPMNGEFIVVVLGEVVEFDLDILLGFDQELGY